MKRESIAVDLDDVLAAHVEAFIAFSNKQYGTHLSVEDYADDWALVWQMERDEAEKRAKQFHTPEGIAEFAVKEASSSALETLGRVYDLYIVTARPESIIDNTKDWVNKYFPGVFKGIHFVPIWVPNNKITKADICQEIGANYLIDDLAGHCNLAASSGIQAILFGDYAWNRHEILQPGVIRCSNWQEVLDYFKLND